MVSRAVSTSKTRGLQVTSQGYTPVNDTFKTVLSSVKKPQCRNTIESGRLHSQG